MPGAPPVSPMIQAPALDISASTNPIAASAPSAHPMPRSSASPPWAAVKRLFDDALAQPPQARLAFVRAADVPADVRAEVLSLLHHHDATADASPFLAEGAAAAVLSPVSRVGQRFGPWQIVRLLGTGGMGDVF